MTISEIKQDLKDLRKLNIDLKTTLETIDIFKKTIEAVSQIDKTEAERTKSAIACIRDANTYNIRYMKAISRLKPLHKTIAIEIYINGKTQEQVAKRINYAKVTLRTRLLPKIINEIKDILENQ